MFQIPANEATEFVKNGGVNASDNSTIFLKKNSLGNWQIRKCPQDKLKVYFALYVTFNIKLQTDSLG